ncbi:unnamed protein product [Adineta steineri]|uniref:Uncharacterized protein n=1 Tax=Adineta steineri TaxID=433720 RepID=A0A814CDK5_9BILA|nr:unnamed protein product [Adineta steineri]CAF0941854.1 unnamed protein product [Adineta steineri]CAF3631026.1 unnamed protein product [Adineta steineri]CAF3686951.1 unnamed protein product [Adineta steineri]
MAKSGFVPAWMKIQSSDKTNGNQKLNLDRSNSNNRQSQTSSHRGETNSTSSSPPIITGRQRHHSSDIVDHRTTRHSPFYYYKTIGQCRNRPIEQQSSNGFDGQSENFFSFSSTHTQSRRSYSRERVPNSFTKNSESNGNESYNGYRSINNSQRRLHSVSSYSNDRPPSTTRHNSTNGNFLDRTSNGDREKLYGNSDMTIKTNDYEQINDSSGFDRLEQDFPSLNGREKHDSSSNDRSSSIWNNAASKFRTSHNEPYKFLDRSLSNNSRTLLGSNRISTTRKDRLLSTPNGLNGTSPSSSSSSPSTTTTTNRSITLELQTNCITQTKNLDKRSDFFNSLKNDSTNDENKNGTKRQYNQTIKTSTPIITNSDKNLKTSKATLLLLSVPETPEEKELLIRMGWKEYDEINYEITDKDKEEYEKQIKLLRKTDNTSAALMSALHRRALPYIDLRDLLRFEMIGSMSDDDNSDD